MADDDLSDAARRLSDVVTLHMLATNGECAGSWVAAKLSDGSTDGCLYDTRPDAVRHHPDYHCYIVIPPDGMGVYPAKVLINFARVLHANGMRMEDPEREFVVPSNREDIPGGWSL